RSLSSPSQSAWGMKAHVQITKLAMDQPLQVLVRPLARVDKTDSTPACCLPGRRCCIPDCGVVRPQTPRRTALSRRCPGHRSGWLLNGFASSGGAKLRTSVRHLEVQCHVGIKGEIEKCRRTANVHAVGEVREVQSHDLDRRLAGDQYDAGFLG